MSRRSTELDGFSRGGHRENSRVRFATSLLAAFISLCLGQAQAQSVPSSQPSVRSLVDANGVDLMTGYYVPTVGPDLSIGTPGAGGLSVSRKHLPTLRSDGSPTLTVAPSHQQPMFRSPSASRQRPLPTAAEPTRLTWARALH